MAESKSPFAAALAAGDAEDGARPASPFAAALADQSAIPEAFRGQSMGNVPANDPVGQSTGTAIRTDRVPGIATQAIGSLPTDPEQRRRVIAGQLFPGMKPEEAQSRMFYGVNGRLAAVGSDGKAFYVDPEPYAPDVNQPSSLMPSNLLARVGSAAGPALPAVAGVAGGVVTAPSSLIVGPLTAGVGAAAGDVARQGLAAYFDPKPGFQYNAGQTATEAGGAVVGQLAGNLMLRGISPNRIGASPLDVRGIRTGGALAEAERINALAQSQGVQLTPGQASGLPSLLGHEDVIASGSAGPGLSDMAQRFYETQRQQVGTAGQNMLDRISLATDKTDAAMQFQQGAEDATRLTRQNANTAARPSYEAAQRGGQMMTPDLAQLAETPAVQAAMTRARVEYQNLYRHPAPDTPDFNLWDLTKRQLDDAHGVARRAGENTTAMAVDSVRGDLVTHLDAAYPTYATARETSAPGQRLAARLESSTGSAVGDGTERARAIVSPVFNTNNPRAIAEARDAFISAGREGEWTAGTRAYVQDTIDAASKGEGGLNAQMLRRQLWGNPDTRAAMQAAMGPQQFQGFDNFMQVVEAAAQARGMNSLTAPRQAGANALQAAAANTPGVHAMGAVETMLNPFQLAQIGGIVPGKIGSFLTQRNLGNISQRLFSPDGMEYLRQMARLSPGTQRAISATTEFLGQTVGRVAGANAANANDAPNLLSAAAAR